jgi:hypothetical protein
LTTVSPHLREEKYVKALEYFADRDDAITPNRGPFGSICTIALINSGRASAQDQPKIPARECEINVAGPNLPRRAALAAFKHLSCSGKLLRIGIVEA